MRFAILGGIATESFLGSGGKGEGLVVADRVGIGFDLFTGAAEEEAGLFHPEEDEVLHGRPAAVNEDLPFVSNASELEGPRLDRQDDGEGVQGLKNADGGNLGLDLGLRELAPCTALTSGGNVVFG